MVRRAILGLGNPGLRYRDTRHNLGYRAIDAIAKRLCLNELVPGYRGVWGARMLGDIELTLAMPLVFMNQSGVTAAALMSRLELSAQDLLVVHDDLDLAFGRIKLKRDGGTGGHRGLESVTAELGDRAFPRLRLGVGRPPPGVDPADFVLASFASEEEEALPDVISRAAGAALAWVELGIERAMNRVNAPPAEPVEGGAPDC